MIKREGEEPSRRGEVEMKFGRLMKMAVAAAAVLFCIVPLKAEASEVISSVEYGEVLYLDDEQVSGLIFTEWNDKVEQFAKEVTADPYFIRYNSLDAVMARLKAGSVASVVIDENGNVTQYKDMAALQQDVAAHLANVAALDAMTPEQRLALENQQLTAMAWQAQIVALLQQEMDVYLQAAVSAGMTEEAAMAQEYLDVCNYLQALLVAKQQALLLYQQNAAPEVLQQALVTVQNYAAAQQAATSAFLEKYQSEVAEELLLFMASD